MLLAQGHEEFKGMCCMNISDHSQSISKQLQQLQDNMHKIQQVSSPLDDFLGSLGWTKWIMELLRMLAGPIIIVGLLVCCLPILMRCCLSCVENSTEALIKRKGGDVGVHAGLLNFLAHTDNGKVKPALGSED